MLCTDFGQFAVLCGLLGMYTFDLIHRAVQWLIFGAGRKSVTYASIAHELHAKLKNHAHFGLNHAHFPSSLSYQYSLALAQPKVGLLCTMQIYVYPWTRHC